MNGSNQKKWILFIILFMVGLILVYFLFRGRLSSIDIEAIADFLRELGPWSILLGGGLIVLQTFFPVVPFLLLAGANVLVFGLWGGFLLTWVSAVGASILMFFVARTVGRNWAVRRMEKYPKVSQLNQYLHKNGFKTILALRLFPVIPPMFVNLASGVSSIEANAYIFATLVGKAPAILVESIIGNDLFHFEQNKMRLILIGLGFGAALLVGMRLMRKKIKVS